MPDNKNAEYWEGKVENPDSGLQLFMRQWRVAKPEGVVVLIHGLGEHSGRYAYTAEKFAEKNLSVYTMDLRTHGKSDGEPQCYIKKIDEFLSDVDCLFEHMKKKEDTSKLEVFLMGHSMGGLLAALYALRFQPNVKGLVLSAPALKPGDDIRTVMIYIARVLGYWLPSLQLDSLNANNLSRDEKVCKGYEEDPLCFHGGIRAGMGAQLLYGFDEVANKYSDMKVPLLIMQGTKDVIVNPDGGKGLYENAASEDKEYKAFEGLFHEIFQEPEKDEVIAHTVEWIKARI